MRAKPIRRAIATVLVASVTLLATPTWASHNQNTTNNTTSGLGAAATTTTMLGVTLVGGPVAITLILVLSSDGGDSESKVNFIRHNSVALRHGITVGGGSAVEALATAFRIEPEHREAFAEMVHDRRDELVPLTKPGKLNADRADEFFEILARGLQSNPELRGELEEISISGDRSEG